MKDEIKVLEPPTLTSSLLVGAQFAVDMIMNDYLQNLTLLMSRPYVPNDKSDEEPK